MNGQPNSEDSAKGVKFHHCPRHQDLTKLMQAAKKPVCNTCFATLKKSYYNVIAGLLLEEYYLHNVTRGLIEQDNNLQKQIQELAEAILRLQSELTEIKKNGKNQANPRHGPALPQIATQAQMEQQQQAPDTKKVCAIGHVAKVAHSLQDLLHLQIGVIMDAWKNKKARIIPKNDDRQDRSTPTHTPLE